MSVDYGADLAERLVRKDFQFSERTESALMRIYRILIMVFGGLFVLAGPVFMIPFLLGGAFLMRMFLTYPDQVTLNNSLDTFVFSSLFLLIAQHVYLM